MDLIRLFAKKKIFCKRSYQVQSNRYVVTPYGVHREEDNYQLLIMYTKKALCTKRWTHFYTFTQLAGAVE